MVPGWIIGIDSVIIPYMIPEFVEPSTDSGDNLISVYFFSMDRLYDKE